VGRPFDTSPEAHERWLEALRAVEPAERFRLAVAMSDEIRALAEAGIRHRHPDLSDDEVNLQFAELLFGADVARVARRSRPIISG
jgi:hypothetical protein